MERIRGGTRSPLCPRPTQVPPQVAPPGRAAILEGCVETQWPLAELSAVDLTVSDGSILAPPRRRRRGCAHGGGR